MQEYLYYKNNKTAMEKQEEEQVETPATVASLCHRDQRIAPVAQPAHDGRDAEHNHTLAHCTQSPSPCKREGHPPQWPFLRKKEAHRTQSPRPHKKEADCA